MNPVCFMICVKRFLLPFLFLFVTTTAGYAIETQSVVVLPFEIHSQKSMGYMSTKIPRVIEKHLKNDGAKIIQANLTELSGKNATWKNIRGGVKGLRKAGVRTGADYVIWGSLTHVGKKFSLDAKMAAAFDTGPPSLFFVEGESIENLPIIVKKLARSFSMKIFRLERVARVLVKGNRRIEADAVLGVIKTAPGDVYLAKSLSADLKAVYAMGYFDDIRIESEEGAAGKTITFRLTEKPTVRMIKILGNKAYEMKEIKEEMDIQTGSILNIYKIRSNIKRIEALYKEKNYHNVKITYEIVQKDNNQADLEFSIQEGKKVRIKTISFSGNKYYTEKQLKKVMETSEKGFWSWLTSSGELKKEVLNQDAGRLAAFYHNTGFIQARVADPEVKFVDDWIYIKIRVNEGSRYKVGNVEINGDLNYDDGKPIFTREDLLKEMKIPEKEFYSREVVRKDILLLTDLYSNKGFAYAEIIPKIDKQEVAVPDNSGKVNIKYVINKKKPVYFEKILITGNTRTRDKVIRRQLKVYERELYDGKALKRGVRNLNRLDYFEDVKVNTIKGSADDLMILELEVTEKNTGMFSFGGGYSSVDDFFVMASITQRNLFGRGHILQLKSELGGSTTRFTLSFTEPWLFDLPLSAGFDLYNWKRDYDDYDKDSKGGAIRFGYPVFDYTRLYLSYAYDIGDIENVEEDASSLVKDMEGTNITSSVSTTLHYDSKDKLFNPTEGMDHSLTVQYAGIGGDIAFTKYLGEAGVYIPMFWGTVGFLHAKTGYVQENSNGKLPDYERFYLGGMNSLRGFDWRDIHELDENGDEIGGNKFVQFNIEYLIPLIKEAGLMGVIFFDQGNVFNDSEKIETNDLRESAGFGFRWYSPIGPIRIENGYILDPKEGEGSSGRWEFTMGSAF